MNEKNKIKMAMLTELCVCITMLIFFLYNTEKLFQFFNLLIAIFSMVTFENHLFKLAELDKEE